MNNPCGKVLQTKRKDLPIAISYIDSELCLYSCSPTSWVHSVVTGWFPCSTLKLDSQPWSLIQKPKAPLEGPKLNSKFHFLALFAVLKLNSKFKSQCQFLKLDSKLNLKFNSQARFISPGFASQSPVHSTVNFLLGIQLQTMIQAWESSFDLGNQTSNWTSGFQIKLRNWTLIQASESNLELTLGLQVELQVFELNFRIKLATWSYEPNFTSGLPYSPCYSYHHALIACNMCDYNVLLVELSLAWRDVGAWDLHGDLGYNLVSLLMHIL